MRRWVALLSEKVPIELGKISYSRLEIDLPNWQLHIRLHLSISLDEPDH